MSSVKPLRWALALLLLLEIPLFLCDPHQRVLTQPHSRRWLM